MQDSQDNTFPIPQADNTQNQIGGSVPQPSDNQMNPSIMPGTSINPTDTSSPVQPDWQTVAAQDNAVINNMPDNQVNPAQNMQNVPSAPMQPNPVDTSSIGVNPALGSDQYSQPQVSGNANMTGYEQAPAANPPLAEPMAPQPVQPDPALQVPSSNMLDLSGNQLPPQPQPSPMASQPVGFEQQGSMQPGVDVSPMPNAVDNAGVPPGFGGNLDIGGMAAPMPPQKSSKKKFIIIGAVVLGFVVILSLILLLTSSSKKTPAVELNQEQVEQTQQATEQSSSPATIPDGYKKVDRDCFSFGAFTPNTINFALTQCKIAAKFGSVSQYDITITAVTTAVTDLQALVDQAKVGTITSQNDIKLNNVDAKQVIQKVNGLDQQTIVVIPANKNYQLDGQTINGFIINTSYNDDTAKKASDTLVSTWTWK